MSGRRIQARLSLLSLLAGLPAVVVAVAMLGVYDVNAWMQGVLDVVIIGAWLGLSWGVHSSSRFHLRTVSNLLAALREGDYSFRVRSGHRDDPFSEIIVELNALAEELRQQRVDDLEATALVRKVMGEIDVAVFAFDAGHRLRLVNRAGERLLGGSAGRLLGQPAADLGLEQCLEGDPARTVRLRFGGVGGRWEMRRGGYRQLGRPHHLLVLSDVSRALRAEELAAWKRLIRVIGHELNNSLAPIKSIAASLERLATRDPLPDDWQEDMERGLGVITSRAEALNRFMSAYSKLAKMPEPTLATVELAPCVRRVAHLESRIEVRVDEGPDITVHADQDQLEQLLINLVRNAADASLETGGGVGIGWNVDRDHVDVWVKDQGQGLSDTANLFVPFFTTKQGGSGIGLFLCRQIADAHGGTVTVSNRSDGKGCVARLRLPGVVGEGEGAAVSGTKEPGG